MYTSNRSRPIGRAPLCVALTAMLLATATARATDYTEVEGASGNSTKANANIVPFSMATGDTITGTTTGTTTAALLTSYDYFRLKSASQPLGIYLHRLTISTSGTAGHTGSIRGLNQASGVITAGTDAQIQASATTVPDFAPRSNMWYGFGREEEIYYRVAGTTSTTSPYVATLTTTPVTPTVIGPFSAGPITFSTEGQTSNDTEFFVFDSTLNPIPTYLNDDLSAAIGQSRLVRSFAPGTYYLAVSTSNTANNEASPADDGNRNSPVMDFADSLCRASTASVAQDWDFTVTDAIGTTSFPNQPGLQFSYQITWFQFTVAAQTNPPQNNACANAIDVYPGATFAGTTNLATHDTNATCDPGGAASRDIWYKHTSNHAGLLSVNTCGSAIDTVVSVYTGACGSLTEVACNDNCAGSPCGGTSSCLSVNVPAGTKYIRVSDKGGTAGEVRLAVTFKPASEVPCAATVIPSLPFTDSVDNSQSVTGDDPACTGTTNPGKFPIWYTYTPAADCRLKYYETSSQDTYFIAYDDTDCNALANVVACTGNESLGLSLTAGHQYFFYISLTTTTAPTVPMSVSFECVQPPANDLPCTATVIPSVPFNVNVDQAAALLEDGQNVPTCITTSNFKPWNSVWFTYTPPFDCTLSMAETGTGGGTWNTVWTVYTGTCDGLGQIHCDDASTTDATTVELQGGTQYWIQNARNFSTSNAAGPEIPTGLVPFSFNCALPPELESCPTARVINSLPYSDTVDHSAFAANGPGGACESSPPVRMQKDVWYTYTHTGANCTGRVTVTPQAPNTYDAILQIWEGTDCSNLTRIACVNRNSSTAPQIEITNVPFVTGQTYKIQYGKVGTSATGSATSSIMVECFAPPANDLPCGATPIIGTPFSDTVDVSTATDDIEFVDSSPIPATALMCTDVDATATYYGVWYSYAATSDCTMILTESSSNDVNMGAFIGTCEGLAQVDCTGSAFEGMTVGLTAGNTYYFLVGIFSFSPPPAIPTTPITVNFQCRPAPANDLVCNASDLNSLGLPYSESVDAPAATHDPDIPDVTGQCNAAAASMSSNGVWYTYTPVADCTLLVTNSGSANVAYGIYTGPDCNSLSYQFCTGNDDFTLPLTGGEKYWILAMLGTANPGLSVDAPMNLSFDCANPPASDQPCNANVIGSVPYSQSVNNALATDDVDTGCNSTSATATKLGVWWTYTPSSDCLALINETSNQDVAIAVFAGPDCNSLGEIGCTSSENYAFPMTGGTQYWILIGSASATPSVPTQPLSMTLDCVANAPPANDLVCNATAINSLPYSDSPLNAAATSDIDVTCNPSGAPDVGYGVWYVMTPSADCTATLSENSTQDVIWATFTGPDCNNLTQNSCSSTDTNVNVPMIGGTTYWILVGSGATAPTAPGIPLSVSITGGCVFGCATCPGDMTGEFTLDGRDIQKFVDCYIAAAGGAPTGGCLCADINTDNTVNSTDLSSMISRMLNPPSCP